MVLSYKVCDRCVKIDFRTVFSLHVRRRNGVVIRRLDHFTQASARGTCLLCRLLAGMRAIAPTLKWTNEMAVYELRAFSAFMAYGFGRRDVSNPRIPRGLKDTVLLGVVRRAERNLQHSWAETGFIAQDMSHKSEEQGQFRPRKVDPGSVDFDIINSWIKFCQENHRKQCELSGSREIQNLRLIDCRARRIVHAEKNQKYAALSYVWGRPTLIGLDVASESLHEKLPCTIEDAIRTTTLVGLEYLWIDRYCISQENKEERHTQISQMDSVYQNAEVTIIAAAGDDPTHGLPGMGSAMRVPQQSIQTSTGVLRSTLPDGKFAVEESLWNTRGWTYQEAILSRRRLVFTKYQIYFQCNGMHCCESIHKPLGILHVRNRQRMRAWNGDGPFNAGGLGTHPWQVLDRIAEFSKRRLTYESDVLNAMTGILNAFRSMRRPVFHHFGVPSLPPVLNTQKIGVAFGKLISLITLPTNPDHGLATGLCWFLEKPSKRRAGFPSWSWIGWMGHVSKPNHDRLQYYFGFPEGHLDVKIWIELEDGTIRRWLDHVTIEIHDRPHYAQYLYLEIYTIRIRFILASDEISGNDLVGCTPSSVNAETRFNAEIVVNNPEQEELVVYCQLILTREVAQGSCLHHRLCTESWNGILFGRPHLEPKDSRSRGGFVMVIDFLDGFWERIGHLNLADIESNWCHQARQLSIPVKKQTIRLG
jgi:hypothetical protein